MADTGGTLAPPPVPTSDLHPSSSEPSVAAGLSLIQHRLGASAVHLYTAADGSEQLVAAVGQPCTPLPALAATLGDAPVVFDVSAVAEDVRFAAGQHAGAAALLALGIPDDRDAAWYAAFADAVAVAAALVPSVAPPVLAPVCSADQVDESARARLLHRVATHPGSFDERLAVALYGLADTLGLEAAAFARIDDGAWVPEAAYDPQDVLPPAPADVSTLLCATTVLADGSIAIHDGVAPFGTYIGAPVFASGRAVGTFLALSREPRAEPFTEADASLVESLARWAGSAVGGREAARRLADREAALAAFVDRAPVAMGLTTLGPDGVVRFVSVNAAAARLLGVSAETLAGLSVDEAGVDGYAGRLWAAGTRRALGRDVGASLPPILIALDTPAGTRAVEATLTRLDVHDMAGRLAPCVSFVAEDVTDREAGLRAAAERRQHAEQAAAEQASLFERLHRDVRTPLTTILGYADLLGPGLADDEAEQIREVISRSAHQLLTTLDATVALAEAARVSIALVPVDAAAVVRDAVRAAGTTARATGVEIAFDAAIARAPLLMDPALVGRIVRAIVDEAAAVPGARHIDTRLADDGNRLVFDVAVRDHPSTDATAAMPPDLLVSRLIERLGGVVDATPDSPWRRTVRLPRHAAVVVDLRRPRSPSTRSTSPSRRLPTRRRLCPSPRTTSCPTPCPTTRSPTRPPTSVRARRSAARPSPSTHGRRAGCWRRFRALADPTDMSDAPDPPAAAFVPEYAKPDVARHLCRLRQHRRRVPRRRARRRLRDGRARRDGAPPRRAGPLSRLAAHALPRRRRARRRRGGLHARDVRAAAGLSVLVGRAVRRGPRNARHRRPRQPEPAAQRRPAPPQLRRRRAAARRAGHRRPLTAGLRRLRAHPRPPDAPRPRLSVRPARCRAARAAADRRRGHAAPRDVVGGWPSGLAWTPAGDAVTFDWNPQGRYDADSTFRAAVSARGVAGPPARMTVSAEREMPPAFPGWHTPGADAARRRIVGTRDGDLFLTDATGRTTRLTRTREAEQDPTFLADGRVAFVRDAGGRPNVFALDVATGAVEQLTDIRAGKAPADEPSPQDAYLRAQQRRLFDVVRERTRRDSLRAAARAARRPGPIYTGGDTVDGLSDRPDGPLRDVPPEKRRRRDGDADHQLCDGERLRRDHRVAP